MAHTTYNVGVHRVMHKFDDVQADFPANGIVTTDMSSVLVNAVGAVVDIQLTYDSVAAIEGGTATWYTIHTVASGSVEEWKPNEYGSTGIKLVASLAGSSAWISC